jgi:hypothetical protein
MNSEKDAPDTIGKVAPRLTVENEIFVDFRNGGNAPSYLRHGWSFPEADGIWGINAESDICLPPITADCDLVFEILLRPMVVIPDLPCQRLEITLNNQSIYAGLLEKNELVILACPVVKSLIKGNSDNIVTLRHPDAAAPALYLASNGDDRALGAFVSSLRLKCAIEPVLAETDEPSISPMSVASDNRLLILFYWDEVPHEIGSILEAFPPFENTFELRFVSNTIPWDVAVASLSKPERDRLFALWEELEIEPGNVAPKKPLDGSYRHMRIPHPALGSLWPLQCHDPRLIAEPPEYPRGRYPHTDRAGVALVSQGGLPDDVLYDRYCAMAREMMPDLETELALDVASWRGLDLRCDIKISDFLAERLRSAPLFFAPKTPAPALLVYIVEHLLASLLPALPISPSALFEQFRYYIHGFQGPFLDQVPINPLVAEDLGLSYYDPGFRYRRGRMKRTFREHILDYIRWEARFS